MNQHFNLTDEAIRAALTPADQVRAPFELAETIRASVDVTRQRRRPWTLGILPRTRTSFRVLALVALVGLLLLVGVLISVGTKRPIVVPLPVSDVSMYHGGPGRTGLVAGPGPNGPVKVLWHVSEHGPITANMPAVVGNVVYAADAGGYAEAYRAATGDPLWQVPLGSPANTSPAVADGVVVVGDTVGDVIGLAATSGQQLWLKHTGGEVRSSAAIVDGVAYIGSADGGLYALDVATGNQRWRFDAGGAVSRSPAIDGGVVYVGANGGILSAVDTKNGTQIWRDPSFGPGQVGTPAVADGLLMAATGLDLSTGPRVLYALDAATGAIRWRFSAPTGQLLVNAALGDGYVFAACADGFVYALEPVHGGQLWTFNAHGSLGSGGSLAAGVLYVPGGDRAVYAMDERTGQQIWKQAITGQPGGVAVVAGVLYTATDLGQVLAIGNAP